MCVLVTGGSLWSGGAAVSAEEIIIGESVEETAAEVEVLPDPAATIEEETAETEETVPETVVEEIPETAVPDPAVIPAETGWIEEYQELEEESFIPDPSALEDPDELLNEYLEQQLYGPASGMMFLMAAPKMAGAYLSGNERAAYLSLAEHIEKIAAGEEVSTEIEISPADLGFEQEYWTAEDLGGIPVFVDNKSNPDAVNAMNLLIGFSLKPVVNALLADYPYDLYWYDKTLSSFKSGPTLRFIRDYDGIEKILISVNCTVSLPVAESYAADTYLVDPELTGAVQTAAENIRGIVDQYAGSSDLEKLNGYRAEICSRTSYNYSAANNSETTPYGDPWQLIWIFDDDPTTTVVCEGYSKAFMHLCDLSVFASQDIWCITVTGTMNGGTGAGAHMWNILHMDNGLNYLVDVTNCDEGTVGADDKLFLAGAESQNIFGYVVRAGSRSITYNYDASTLDTYRAEDLLIADSRYEPGSGTGDDPGTGDNPGTEDPIDLTTVVYIALAADEYAYTGSEVCPELLFAGNIALIEGTDYTVRYEDNTDPGNAAVIIEGCGKYTGTVVLNYTILPEPAEITAVTITASGIKITWSSALGAANYILYRRAGSGAWEELTRTASRSYADTGVKAGTIYRYAVSCVNPEGREGEKRIAAQYRKYLAPVTPKLANTSSGVKVTWDKAAGATSYQIFRKTDTGSWPASSQIATSALSWTDTSVKTKDGSVYQYAVVACYGSGNSESISTKSAKRIARQVAPAAPTVSNTAAGKITVKWTRSSKATGYQIQYSTSSSFASSNKAVTITKNTTGSKVIGSLTKGKTYYVRIRKYKTVKGIKYYSAWSAKKTVKITK